MAKRSTAGLVKYVKFLMEAGVMERPVWLNALERVPPPPLPKAGRRPQTINFPEDEIIRAYYKRNPGASLEPIDLGSYEPSTARRFASRQLELMDQGLSRKDARLQTQSEFTAEAAASNEKGVIAIIQDEEEIHLDQAMKTYVERHGHKPLQQMGNNNRGGGGNAARPQMINTTREAMKKLPAPPVKSMTSDAPPVGTPTTVE